MGRGVGDGKSGQNRKPEAFLKSQRIIKISTFFSIFFSLFSDPKLGRVVGGAPPRGRPGKGGGCAPNGKISFLHRFREIRGHTYHNHHQNHGLDVGRAHWFGPEWPGFGDTAWLKSAFLGCHGPPVGCSSWGAKNPFLGQKNGRGGRWRRYRRALRLKESCRVCPRTPWSLVWAHTGRCAGCRGLLLVEKRLLVNSGP